MTGVAKLKPQFYRRSLPETCISFCSEEGKVVFREALSTGHMEGYFGLAAQFRTQDEPAFCGLSTLVMVLNALEVDPKRVWKGPWRWYHEQMLDCCIPIQVVEQKGITIDQFACLASCNTLDVKMTRAKAELSEEEFRNAVEEHTKNSKVVIVASYSRKVLEQTGDGHFSPIAGYHKERDLVLILDTARFKYPPHWVKLPQLFEAMKSLDKDTGLSRGYLLLSRSTTQPQLVFEINPLISITATVGQDMAVAMKLQEAIKTWICWLDSVPGDDDPIDMVPDAVCTLYQCLCEDEHTHMLLKVKRELNCSPDLSEEHCCALEDIVRSLMSLTMFQRVKDAVKNINPKLECVECGEVTELECHGSCAVQESCSKLVSSLTVPHCLAMVLLSWPYKHSQGSRGSLLQTEVSRCLNSASPALQNEVAQLCRQWSSMLGWFHTCKKSKPCRCLEGQYQQS